MNSFNFDINNIDDPVVFVKHNVFSFNESVCKQLGLDIKIITDLLSKRKIDTNDIDLFLIQNFEFKKILKIDGGLLFKITPVLNNDLVNIPVNYIDILNVILAGFGRFGSVVGRYLRANGVEATVLDNDPDRVDLLRKLGFKVYYGDATSLEMLEAAGIKNADMLILTLHDKDAVSFIINHVKANYPKIKLFVRAYGRLEAYELLDQGLSKVYRDSFETALSMGIDVLSALGIRKYSATRAAQKFRQHDEESLPVLAKVRHNRNIYVKSARERIEDQEDQLKRDMKRLGFTLDDHAWDSEPLRAQNKS